MLFVYFNKRFNILQSQNFLETTFYNIGDFLRHETPLAVSRTVSQLSRVSVEKARKSPTAIFPEKPRTETVT